MREPTLHISGAGPAGLAAAITYAKAGGQVIVHERKDKVGSRFHGDFQGQENWTSSVDVIDDLQSMGVENTFPYTPFYAITAYDAWGKQHDLQSEQPFFYLVTRGSGAGTLDNALVEQASRLGVDIRYHDKVTQLPEGGICAEGPKAGDVIATGYQFDTKMPDAAYAILSDDLAPKGYAYLLIHQGHATLASCMYDNFHDERLYLDRTVQFFQNKLGFIMDENAKHFGGLGNIFYPKTASKGNILYVGEAAGFQDALWGFGMRYAMISGHLAAKAWLQGRPQDYDAMWQQALGGKMRASIVNRFMFSKIGNHGYRQFLTHLKKSKDVRQYLFKKHQECWYSHLLFPWVNRLSASKRKEAICMMPNCQCTWCRCKREEEAV